MGARPRLREQRSRTAGARVGPEASYPPGWEAFIVFCRDLQFGEIERLKIQDGIPVSAETVKTKIKFK